MEGQGWRVRGFSCCRNAPHPGAFSVQNWRVGGREFFIDNLLVRIHIIIVMIRWTGLAPWECYLDGEGGVDEEGEDVGDLSFCSTAE